MTARINSATPIAASRGTEKAIGVALLGTLEQSRSTRKMNLKKSLTVVGLLLVLFFVGKEVLFRFEDGGAGFNQAADRINQDVEELHRSPSQP